jgi:undecaprenyl diphosphate synthase
MNQIATPFLAAVSALSSMTQRMAKRTTGLGKIKTSDVVPHHVALVVGTLKYTEATRLTAQECFTRELNTLHEVTHAALKQGIRCLSIVLSDFWNTDSSKPLLKFLTTESISLLQSQSGIRLTVQMSPCEGTSAVQEALLKLKTHQPPMGTEKLRLHLILNRDGANELVRATQQLARKVQTGTLSPMMLTQASFEHALRDTTDSDVLDLPEVDLLLHTADRTYLSRTLLWKAAYAELFFSTGHWFEFTQHHLAEALSDYAGRRRTFGGLK